MSKLISGATGDWEVVLGLEVHAQVTSNAKLFSGAATEFGAEPNTQVSLVDAAMPGMLPVINAYCVEQAVRTGLALNAQINLYSIFDRKNYFYADLPQGYQISQYKQPVVGEGIVTLDLKDGETKEVGIERLHLEQDAGKSMHDQHPTMTYVDLNRSGVALMEIVSKPDMRSSEEAGAYLKKLRTILRYIGTCDGNMEQGSMRADVNVSVRKPGGPLGTRCEIKNVNSVRYVQQAIEYEARRQIDLIEDGGTVTQETRLFDPGQGVTRSLRSKEEAHDYRYFPDPDLLPLELEPAWVEKIKASLPELPDDKKRRLMEEEGLSAYDAGVLVAEAETTGFFDKVYIVKDSAGKEVRRRNAKEVANTVINKVFAANNAVGVSISESVVDPIQVGILIDRKLDGTISVRGFNDAFEIMAKTGEDADVVIANNGLRQITDTGFIEGIIDKVIAENPGQVAQYDGGANPKVIGWFVGQVMKQSQGKANPGQVNELLKKKLG
ncbi:MAG: Asp-tRNA(Asn)/Glu-tRNA(Gln) amidotransferase subunit GatB [Sphingomonadales bacterium]